ncbi:hypothetical protein [Dyella silvae]|uniref:hypothetical protein n=1 Tax=Dyella silvae TaxID=2994424 RepID=UPI002263F2E0|nr:hypothetical protein [Dyella silvae]
MLFFGFSFPKVPAATSKPDQTVLTDLAATPVTVAPASYTERHCDQNVVDGLGHYIDSRLGEGRFRID